MSSSLVLLKSRLVGKRYTLNVSRAQTSCRWCGLTLWGYGSPVVKVSNYGRRVMSSTLVPLKTRRVGERCMLNLSRAETSSQGVVWQLGERGASSGVVLVT
ncbi:hypothetical protein TNCV_2110311 [Trichonephila clavipes]|nr:hypothetical protein TNCV_2110311 [Trichonephila clavipes]